MHFSLAMNLSKTATTLFLAGGLLLYGTSNLQAPRSGSVASGKNGIVVAGEKRAADIGTQVLEKGGNAADAATAALLALSVTKIGSFTIGGEASVIFYDAHERKAHVLWAQGAAPLDQQAISWYLKNGMPASDIRTAAVPAVVDLCVTLLQQYGTISFEEAVKPTLALLDAGGPSWYIDTSDGSRIETGRNWQADLARTLRKLVEAEQKTKGNRGVRLQAVADRFYRGDIADELEAWYISQGGFLRKRDLAAHRTYIEDPVSLDYRGYRVLKCGPWTQGPYLLEGLRLLEGFDLKKMGLLSADYIHTVTEVMKLAMADRDEYYADPRFVQVPMQRLLSEEYAKIRRPLIDPQQASLELRPGDPYQMKSIKKGMRSFPTQGGTTTLTVVDRWGNMVAATPSGLGSTAGPAGNTGIIHGSRLISFNTWPGHPNCIAPGKRPRITLSPALVLKEGKPVVAISVAGGDLQDQAGLQLILDYIEFSMQSATAVSTPRFATAHHISSFGQEGPKLGSLQVNRDVPEETLKELEHRGHKVQLTSGEIGGAAMIWCDLAGTSECEGSGSAARSAGK
ncbi:MAG: gamma-glutamyltransferase [Candidatus Acidiferrum sp.]|jgi:gamma-glutamyltranspeptidase/glutathione hydrolase